MSLEWGVVWEYMPRLLEGAWMTVWLTVVTMALAIPGSAKVAEAKSEQGGNGSSTDVSQCTIGMRGARWQRMGTRQLRSGFRIGWGGVRAGGLLGVEDFLAVVAPLGEVVRCADRHHARGSRHETSFSTGCDAVNRRPPG